MPDASTTARNQAFFDTEPPWQNCIAVCAKCAAKVNAMDGDKTLLRVALKKIIGERDMKQALRAVDTSCLDVCPEERITIAHFTRNGVRLVDANPAIAAEQILSEFGY